MYMKFEKLFNLVVEAKGTKPGDRYHTATNSDPTRTVSAGKGAGRVSPMASSPVGKADNFEIREPINDWTFHPDVDMDKSGVKLQSKVWRTLFNAFSLLSNDKSFQNSVGVISKKFDKSRDSYKNVIGVVNNDKKTFVSYDEESRVNTLPQTIDKQKSKRTGYESEIAKRRTILNYTKMGPSAKIDLKKEIESIKGQLKVIDTEMDDPKHTYKRKERLQSEFDSLTKKLNVLEDRLQSVNISSTDSIKVEILDFRDKIEELDKKIKKNEEELTTLTDRTTKIQSNNEESNDIAINEFIEEVGISARRIKNSLADEIKQIQADGDDIDGVVVDWSNVPKNFKYKVKMLDDLESKDPKVNPIVGYIDSFNRWYYDIHQDGTKSRVKDLDSREFNPQLNITKIRDYMSLPFVRLMSIYSSSSIPKMSLKKEADLRKHDEVYQNFKDYIAQFPSSNDASVSEQNRKAWVDPETKEMLRSFIAGMAIESKDFQYNAINQPWRVSRSGLNNFQQLKSSIDADMKRFIPKEESFDKIFDKIISEKVWDEDDFKLDTMEVLSHYK